MRTTHVAKIFADPFLNPPKKDVLKEDGPTISMGSTPIWALTPSGPTIFKHGTFIYRSDCNLLSIYLEHPKHPKAAGSYTAGSGSRAHPCPCREDDQEEGEMKWATNGKFYMNRPDPRSRKGNTLRQ